SLFDLPRGLVQVRCDLEGFTSKNEGCEVEPGGTYLVNVDLVPGHIVRVAVVDGRDGRPIDGATIDECGVATRADGRASFTIRDELLEDGFGIETHKHGYRLGFVRARAEDLDREFRIEMLPAVTVRGIVVDRDGRPLEGAWVSLGDVVTGPD